jgi:polysaccharide deacetylase family protein (PEP-CTERM system associated)
MSRWNSFISEKDRPHLIFTMDVEEWYHAENISKYVRDASHSSLSRVASVLDELDKQEAFGTFFVIGELAQKNSMLIREIVGRGHEIASHGWNHRLIDSMNSKELLIDLRESKDVLEQVSGEAVLGYRSPCFSANRNINEMLAEAGYRYSSCGISASFHDRYGGGFLGKSLEDRTGIPDFPLPSTELFGRYIPSTGGGYFRLFPLLLQNWLLNRSRQDPLIFYCHPWDFDVSQPLSPEVPFISRFRHTVGNSHSLNKLSKLTFSAKPLRDFV